MDVAQATDCVARENEEMTNPINGIVHVMGEHDTGKTLFALSCGALPERIAFIDDDVKGSREVRQIRASGHDFGLYVDLVKSCSGMREIAFNEHCMGIIRSLKVNQYDALVWDTWSRFASTFINLVIKNPSAYKDMYSDMGKIKAGERYHVAWDLEAEAINLMLQSVPLVILITHLKDHYLNNVKTGKEIPASTQALERVPNMRVWLRHNPDSPEPIGLFLKRPNKILVTDNGLKPINVLPRKMNPCTWERIIEYWQNPIGNRPLNASEKPDEYELSILDSTLTTDQKKVLELASKFVEDEGDMTVTNQSPNGAMPQSALPDGFREEVARGASDDDLRQHFNMNALQLMKAKKAL